MSAPTPELPPVEHSTPRLLATWRQPSWRPVCMGLSVLSLLAWGVLAVGEWYMRFHWYQWQNSLLVRTDGSIAGPGPCRTSVTNAPGRGGGLSRLLGIPSLACRYEESRPAYVSYTDEDGYANIPPTRSREYPVVVVGDSFMASGGMPMEQTFAAQLVRASGLNVYNHACAGRGTFWALLRFLASERFRAGPPKMLVWGIIEEELGGPYFMGGYGQAAAACAAAKPQAQTHHARWDWQACQPAALHRSLPMSSLYSQYAAKVWNQARFFLLGELNPAVLPAACPVAGGPMLFYRYAVVAMQWSRAKLDPPQIVEAISRIADLCQRRRIQLAVVLIPSKERVYESALPADHLPLPGSIRPSILPELSDVLRRRGVPVVNLLEPYRLAAQRGELLYWRDDTHWNAHGIELAAQEAWRQLAPALR